MCPQHTAVSIPSTRSATEVPELRRIGLRDLVLFNISAIASIRWIGAAAHAGSVSLLVWVGAAIFFFVPSALVVAGLARRFPEQGGIYAWSRDAFGPWHGFLCGWFYWLSNLFFLPTLLVAGLTIALLAVLGPGYTRVADRPALVIPACLLGLWLLTAAHLRGIETGKWASNLGAVAALAAVLVLCALAIARWPVAGSQSSFGLTADWDLGKINFLSQMAFAFGGLELAASMAHEIRDPGRIVPRAAWISCAICTLLYVAGTTAMLVLMTSDQINVITGIAEAGFSVSWAAGTLLAVLALISVAGNLGSWIGGCARVPFAIGVDRHLPPVFARLDKRTGTPYVALLIQAVVCTVFFIAMQAGESVRVGYQTLVDMTVVTYFLPYEYLFLTAFKHGMRWSALAGLTVSTGAIVISCIPPPGTQSAMLFEAKLIGGTVVLILLARLFYRKQWTTASQ